MNGSVLIPPVDVLKEQAKLLRQLKATDEKPVSHSQSLELIAHQYGCRDWNTLRATSENQPRLCPVVEGDRISGLYLSQPFTAIVLKANPLENSDLFRITMHFDEPVDVVTHDSFSSFRQRVSGNIDHTGQSPQKTSDGQPQIRLNLSGRFGT